MFCQHNFRPIRHNDLNYSYLDFFLANTMHNASDTIATTLPGMTELASPVFGLVTVGVELEAVLAEGLDTAPPLSEEGAGVLLVVVVVVVTVLEYPAPVASLKTSTS